MANGEVPRGEQILALTEDLIRIPSTKEHPEALHQVIDRAKLELPGFGYEEFAGEVRDADGKITAAYPSILFFNGSERPERFRVLLHGHLDVVPAQNEDQYTPKRDGRRLYGRGADDMKAGAAAIITVFRELAATLPYPIGLSLTTDEEIGGFNGAGRQVAEGVQTDFVISAESNKNFEIGNEHKGVLIFDLKTEAKGGHTAYDGNDANALQIMVDYLKAVNERYPGSTGKWRTTSSVTEVSTSNNAHNVVPSDAQSQIAFRVIPQDDPDVIKRFIRTLDPRVKIEIDEETGREKIVSGDAHITRRNHPDVQALSQAVRQVTGRRASFSQKAGSSDIRHWTGRGSDGVDFGPSGAGLHTENEYLEIDSLEPYAQILTAFLTSIQ